MLFKDSGVWRLLRNKILQPEYESMKSYKMNIGRRLRQTFSFQQKTTTMALNSVHLTGLSLWLQRDRSRETYYS